MIFSLMAGTALPCFIAWLIPGGGHLYFRKWGRGLLFFAVVTSLFFLGLAQDGRLFGPEPGVFGFLKFFANASTGLLYILGRLLEWGPGDIRAFGYEYGNTYIYTAGLLNMLLIVDAFDLARGKKQ